MTEHEERNRTVREEKRQRKLALGLEEPTRREVFIKIVERLKAHGLSQQEIYETVIASNNVMRQGVGLGFGDIEGIIGGDITYPDFKLLFKKAK